MKKFRFVLLIAALALLIGCSAGGVSPESFVVTAGEYKIVPSEDNGLDDAALVELHDMGVYVRKTLGGVDGDIGFNEKGARLACGLAVGDSVDKVLQTLGKNKVYQDEGTEDRYELTYFYYMKDGRLNGVSDQINYNHILYLKLDEAEEAVFEKIKDDIGSGDNYFATFHITNSRVEIISVRFMKMG